MPEQMMCPMRSDAKIVRHCEPSKCMWGRYTTSNGNRYWTCSASSTDAVDNTIRIRIEGEDDR